MLQMLKNASCMTQSNQHGHFPTLLIFSSLPLLKMIEEVQQLCLEVFTCSLIQFYPPQNIFPVAMTSKHSC